MSPEEKISQIRVLLEEHGKICRNLRHKHFKGKNLPEIEKALFESAKLCAQCRLTISRISKIVR